MYEAFYGMRDRPFSPIPQPECFVPLPQMADAIRDLRNCVERDQGIAVLTAPAGAGKTLLCKRLCSELADRFACAFLGTSRFPSRRALLQGILYELGQPYIGLSEQEARLGVLNSLRGDSGEGQESPRQRSLLLVMDEAHLLPPRFLEELRTLADYHANGRSLIHVVLSGQLALEETLSEGPLSALNQRVGCHVCLEALGADESAEYIRHRLAWVGCDVDSIFSPEALSLIVHAAEGNPRRINQLADHALLIAFAEEERLVSLGTVQSALVDLRELPLQWNEPLALSWEEATGAPDLSMAPSRTETSSAPSVNVGPPVVFEWGCEGDGPHGSHPVEGQSLDATESARFSIEGEPVASRVEPEAPMPDSEPSEAAVFETGIPAHAQEGSSELMTSPFANSTGYEEIVVEDRYARLDRRNESGVSDFDVDPLSESAAASAAVAEIPESGFDRPIEEELRDLLIAMQSEVAAAISPRSSLAFPETGPVVYDVVEPEEEEVIEPGPLVPTAMPDSYGTVPFSPAITSYSQDDVIPASVPESRVESTPGDTGETAEPSTRRYAHLFSRLQRQRSLMDILLKRDRH